jgi:hypothetical protein
MNMNEIEMSPQETNYDIERVCNKSLAVRYALRYFEIFPTEDHNLLEAAGSIYEFITGEKA